MRKDVANLLQRLGKRDFQYQEFADRFTDVELWPIFETLIRDPRILTMDPHEAAAQAVARPGAVASDPVMPAGHRAPAEQAAPTPTPSVAEPAAGTDLNALFARYGGGRTDEVSGDVRTLLQHLAQQIEQGKL